MPQMKPMNWLILLILFSIILMMMIIINFSTFILKNLNFMKKNKLKNNYWKW